MRFLTLYVTALCLALAPLEASSRDGRAIWDSRCEECHGDPDRFARKYLWNVDGELQGQHHIDDLSVFMRNHYIPDHEVKIMHDTLLMLANSVTRYEVECAECHGDVRAYVEKSLQVGEKTVTIIESGLDAGEFLLNHQELGAEDVTYYVRLFSRIAGDPLSVSSPLPSIFR